MRLSVARSTKLEQMPDKCYHLVIIIIIYSVHFLLPFATDSSRRAGPGCAINISLLVIIIVRLVTCLYQTDLLLFEFFLQRFVSRVSFVDVALTRPPVKSQNRHKNDEYLAKNEQEPFCCWVFAAHIEPRNKRGVHRTHVAAVCQVEREGGGGN